MTARHRFSQTAPRRPKPRSHCAVVTEGGPPALLVSQGRSAHLPAVTLASSSGRNTQILEGNEPAPPLTFSDLPPWAKSSERVHAHANGQGL